jgi:hypothetical protein
VLSILAQRKTKSIRRPRKNNFQQEKKKKYSR